MYSRPLAALFLGLAVGAAPIGAQTLDRDQPPVDQSSQGDPSQGDKKEVHPPPAHTGWVTLLKDTAQDFVTLPKRQSTWVLVGIGAAGALATHPADDYVASHIVGNPRVDNAFKPGKWIGSATTQIGTAVGLWAVGRYVIAPVADQPQTNRFSHLGFDLLRAQMVSQALVHGVKYTVRRDRPTGECCSFPSGHAATAFAAASVLERHFGYRGSWPALVGATYVATSRLVERRHFLSDVVFGAAIGTATGWTVVGRHGRNEYALQPVPVPGGIMITVAKVSN